MSSVKDVIIYMHGITPAREPQRHTQDYDALESLLIPELRARGKAYPQHRIDMEWGFDAPSVSTKDRILAATERMLAETVSEIAGQNRDLTLNPLRPVHELVRQYFILGLADMFYYVSEDGKADVRQNILNTLLDRLPPLGPDETYSFTIVAHSAGSAIMHDLLFIIFGGSSKSFLSGESAGRLQTLQEYARLGKVFVKCFVTIGALITPLIVRSRKMLEMIYNNGTLDGKLDLDSIGIRAGPIGTSRWLNFWDKDDPVSFPVAFLYHDPDDLVRDYYVDIGDIFPLVHMGYWSSKKVAEIIAEDYPVIVD